MPTPPAPDPGRQVVEAPGSLGALALTFFLIGLNGFGGVQPVLRRFLVERRAWLTDGEYAALLGMGQALPGANTVNASVILGDRFFGWRGAVVAPLSLLAAPLALLVVAALLLDRFGGLPDVAAALAGVAAGAAGMLLATGLKMATGLRPDRLALLTGGAAFVAVALFGLSMPLVVLVLAPVGFLLRRTPRERRP